MQGRLWRNRRGSMAVQFALVAPALLMLLFGIIEVGRMVWTRSSLQYATEQAGRYAMVKKGATSEQIANYLKSRAPYDADRINVTVTTTPETVIKTEPSGATTTELVTYINIVAQTRFETPAAFLDMFDNILLQGRARVLQPE
jgi:Flp pilus assembly protein TadG